MDIDGVSKDIILLVVGAAFAQGINIALERSKRFKLKRALLEELRQLQTELDRYILSFKRDLQIASLKGISNNFSMPIRPFIYESHYKDVVLHLNAEQKTSYQMIYSYIEEINDLIARQRVIVAAANERGKCTAEEVKNATDLALMGFINCHIALWHIKYHIKNKSKPTLITYDGDHKNYLQHLQSVHDEAKEILDEKNPKFTKDDFNKIYNPINFGE